VNSVVPATADAWYAGQVYSLAVITQVDRYHQFSLDELGYLISGKSGLNMQQVSRMTECPVSNESYGLGIEYFEGLGYGHTGSHLGYLTIAVYDPETDWMVVSESTLYPNDHTLNMAEAKAIVVMLHKMKQTVGY